MTDEYSLSLVSIIFSKLTTMVDANTLVHICR